MQRYERIKQIEGSEGARLYRLVRALQVSVRTYSVNWKELKGSIEDLSRPPLFPGIWAPENSQAFDEFLAEITRFLHNFLASATTLIDHTRVFVDETALGSQFKAEYQRQIQLMFKNAPHATFVKDLRNLTVHRGFPTSKVQLRMEPPLDNASVSVALMLDVSALKKWGGWTKPSRAMLDGLKTDLVLLEVLSKYHKDIEAFYHWFFERGRCLYGEPISTFLEQLRQVC